MRKKVQTLINRINHYRIQILLGVSIVVLITLLLIQIRWINRARDLNEEQFNHRVGMALHESVDEFMKDRESCETMSACMNKSKFDANDSAQLESEVERLDSIIKQQFKNYQIQSPYNIEVLSSADEQPRSKCFYYSLRKALSHDKAVLNVYFQKREQSILDSMGSMFILSMILILILFVFFGITVLSLFKDKKILGRTTDLINNIAHEFKTPMATIALAGKMLGREKVYSQSEQVKHYANVITSENNRLKKQIDQLLKLSCIDRGELQLNSNQFKVHDLLSECIETLSVSISEREGDLLINNKASNDLITGDRELIQNVFLNLLDNAIKYSPGKPELSIETKNINGSLHVLVSDKGIGMNKEEQKHVFERYYRAPTGDRHDVKGFGIGLSYSRMIIDAHKGSINVWSKKNYGSTFTVIIPQS
ncbi:sensor histidine kinase [Marinifilum caeruleilacunae]|uniref:histidine kinase n=1 Tax=Marinifilum caeruleilacunae TaxID=2499076 RepID=A0ABX1WX98_9BACT|nr:HAMP domain-containing sensor histidine kinase [Marinifilum caeruleilacunae]NOU60621.1 HAMP domain-containing histidine kinase [Marinifilum caeruleilacunae]